MRDESSPKREDPQIGDLYVCVGCAGISQFDEQMLLVRMTAGQLAALDPELQEALTVTQTEVRQLLFQRMLSALQPRSGLGGRLRSPRGQTPGGSSH